MSATTLHDPHDTDRLFDALEADQRVGIDTEFMRERTYFAQLCLVQIAIGQDVWFADPLEDDGLQPVWDRLLRREWVLHSGRQDIEVLYQTTQRMPAALFDTQIAAALAGYAPQIGYANLVRELFGKELPKSHTRADWTKRPLPTEMLRYAAEDVEYLLDAADALGGRLQELGRLAWAEEDSRTLLDPAVYAADPAQAVSRLKAARNLRGRARRAAVRLASWREQRALAANRPRRWILKDSPLLEIAQSHPSTLDDLASIDGVAASTVRRSGREILALIEEADDSTDDYQPPARPGEREKAQLKAMQDEVARCATGLGVAQEVLAPRKDLSALVRGERDVRAVSGWRRTVVGERLLTMLD